MEIDHDRGMVLLREEEAWAINNPDTTEMPLEHFAVHVSRWQSSTLTAVEAMKSRLKEPNHGPLFTPEVVEVLERNSAVIANMRFVFDTYQENLATSS